MNPMYGSLTADQRETLTRTAERVALLPVAGCSELSTQLACIAHTRHPSPGMVDEAIRHAQIAHRALLADACPDRWIDELSGFGPIQQFEIAAGLASDREGQADQVAMATQHLNGLRLAQPTPA